MRKRFGNCIGVHDLWVCVVRAGEKDETLIHSLSPSLSFIHSKLQPLQNFSQFPFFFSRLQGENSEYVSFSLRSSFSVSFPGFLTAFSDPFVSHFHLFVISDPFHLSFGTFYPPFFVVGNILNFSVLFQIMGYIGAHGVAALRKYKYSGVDHSYVAKYVLQPFWSRFVHIFPLWMPWVISFFNHV